MGKRKLRKIEKKLRSFGKKRRFMEYGERNRQEVILLRIYTSELHKKIKRLEKKLESDNLSVTE
jgi:hypothetical protein